jgi:uncharacterized cupin superfamily protein
MLVSQAQMKTLIIIEGFGTVLGTAGSAVEFKAGDCLLIPAGYEGVVRFAQETEYLTVTI